MITNFEQADQQQQQEVLHTETEENIVFKQRQQQRSSLISKIEESLEGVKEKDYDELIKLRDYVFTLYTFFENEWKGFTNEGDIEIGNCYKFCINKLNIFKNILRSFFSYMKNKGDDIVIECLDSFQKPIQKVKKQFIRFSERHPANNKSMQVLFEYDRYGRQFEYFLNFYAVDWLIKSKVKDIIPHLLSIFFLLRCFQAPQLKDQLKVYKKTKKITLPRKVRKSNAASKLNEKEEDNIKCEEVSSMQFIDSYMPSIDSLNGNEENKSICFSSMQESQSLSSSLSSYSDNPYFLPYPQKQFSFFDNQNENQQTQAYNEGYSGMNYSSETQCNCALGCQQQCYQFNANTTNNNDSKFEFFENEIYQF